MNRLAGLLFLFLLLIVGVDVLAQGDWKEIRTAEELHAAYPDILPALMAAYDLDFPGLEGVKEAAGMEDYVLAARLLLDYYATSSLGNHLRQQEPLPGTGREASADTILKDVYTVQEVKGKVPVLENGHRDWHYLGPNSDVEWAWLSNRHDQLYSVYMAWLRTGNPEYASFVNLFLKDFIIASWPYPAKRGSGSVWRGLEVSFRAKVWPRIFFGMMESEYLEPATRLLILSSLPDHAHYNRNFHAAGNWLTMELSGLAWVAACFPEYGDAEEWLEYATGQMTRSLEKQIYPDGVQYELTSHYHLVALSNFEEFRNTLSLAGKELPSVYTSTLEKMYDYLAKSIRPDGNGLLNNDGDLTYNRDRILMGAREFGRTDWQYMASGGKEGLRPDACSWFFPWAGQLISRSSWDPDASWSFFDLGPWGYSHQHNDKLHISLSAFGQDFLVDAGRFAYAGEVARKFRPYALGGAGHNVLLIDGKGQGPGPKLAAEPLGEESCRITPEFDYALSSAELFEGLEGNAEHSRGVFFVRDGFWVVVDRVHTDRPREVDALWHWHSECEVETANGIVTGSTTEGELHIIPIGDRDYEVSMVRGQEEPSVQGWYSSEYNVYEPSTATCFKTWVEDDACMVWILCPSQDSTELIRGRILDDNGESLMLELFASERYYRIRMHSGDASKAELMQSDLRGSGDVALLGDNSPHANVNDGDFTHVRSTWRQAKQSPYWTTRHVPGKGDKAIGLHEGKMFTRNAEGIIESRILDDNPDYPAMKAGDLLHWSFGVDSEYRCGAEAGFCLVFGEQERVLRERVSIEGGKGKTELHSGRYVVTEDDVVAGMPMVRVRLFAKEDVRTYLDYVNLSVEVPERTGPQLLFASENRAGISLVWKDSLGIEGDSYRVYRKEGRARSYYPVSGALEENAYLDKDIISGISYKYLVVRIRGEGEESSPSPVATIRIKDDRAPSAPGGLEAMALDTEVQLIWKPGGDKDVKGYVLYRGESESSMEEIAYGIAQTRYHDFTPAKGVDNIYEVRAVDHSGNLGEASSPVKARVRAVPGASFRDLILPMPIHDSLRSNLWGAEGVVPRDPSNGIEDPEWSYWGGRPVEDRDGRFHMLVTRWPANATKGHWDWPNSTVAHVVADKPTGPYEVVSDLAYSFMDGLGHNPDIVLLNDGSYMLYSLIDWEATLFTSESMAGPWKRLGTMMVNDSTSGEDPGLWYRHYRNLSGLHLDDGRFLFVTKAGAMMISEGKDPLGPYNLLTPPVRGNTTIPEKYRYSNYEDPVIWRDEVQFHMMVNAFWDFRAIYMRSPDGINWKFNPGVAYDPGITRYEDGTRTHWYKLERPHVLTDGFGRATHLSLAVLDVPKADDRSQDEHNSKNIIVPLQVHRRIKLLNKKRPGPDTGKLKVLILSEPGFDAPVDVDPVTLRFGASEAVDFGEGSKAIKWKKRGDDLLVIFDGAGNGITDDNFAGKLLGRTSEGELLVGFCKLQSR